MCMEDVRLGRKTQSIVSTFSITATPVRIAAFNPRRVAIAISINNATAIAVVSMGASIAGNGAFTVALAGGMVKLNIQHDGAITFSEMWASSATGHTMYVIETILDEV